MKFRFCLARKLKVRVATVTDRGNLEFFMGFGCEGNPC